jgi:hypothetical protein
MTSLRAEQTNGKSRSGERSAPQKHKIMLREEEVLLCCDYIFSRPSRWLIFDLAQAKHGSSPHTSPEKFLPNSLAVLLVRLQTSLNRK